MVYQNFNTLDLYKVYFRNVCEQKNQYFVKENRKVFFKALHYLFILNAITIKWNVMVLAIKTTIH